MQAEAIHTREPARARRLPYLGCSIFKSMPYEDFPDLILISAILRPDNPCLWAPAPPRIRTSPACDDGRNGFPNLKQGKDRELKATRTPLRLRT